jgi:hypothetical protein
MFKEKIREIIAFLGFIKMSKESALYTDHAPSMYDCHLCLDFLPELSRCSTVSGRISPNGWCKRFTAKRFAPKSSLEGDKKVDYGDT